MTIALTYDSTLARVRIDSTPGGTPAYATIERSINGLSWTVIRGGSGVALVSGDVAGDDYEFVPGVVNTYRVRTYSPVDVLLTTETDTITPTIDRVWLKSVARPFLNQAVVIREYSPINRRARAGLFEIPGRSFPVRVGTVASSRSWTMEILTTNETEQRNLEFLVASGDVVYVQVPAGFDIPGGFVGLGDMSLSRISRPLSDGRRQFSLPMTAVAAPGPDVVGYTATWAGLLAEFGTWTEVLAAFPTWADALEYVSDPEIVIVP